MPDFITCDLSELTEDVLIDISDTDLDVLVSRFANHLYVNTLEYALELFAEYEDFKLETIKTSGGCFLWKASVPTLPGFECREFDIDPARAVAKLYIREKISVPHLKMWLEERGLLDVNHKTE